MEAVHNMPRRRISSNCIKTCNFKPQQKMRMKCSWECDKEAVELKVKLLQGIYHTLQQESFVKGGQLRSSGLMNLMYLSTFKSV